MKRITAGFTISAGVIGRDEAERISPEYVRFVDGRDWDHAGARLEAFEALDVVLAAFAGLRKGQKVLTHLNGQFIVAKVTSVKHDDFRAVDGPIVRVGNGEFTWRVDGDRYAFPIVNGAPKPAPIGPDKQT